MGGNRITRWTKKSDQEIVCRSITQSQFELMSSKRFSRWKLLQAYTLFFWKKIYTLFWKKISGKVLAQKGKVEKIEQRSAYALFFQLSPKMESRKKLSRDSIHCYGIIHFVVRWWQNNSNLLLGCSSDRLSYTLLWNGTKAKNSWYDIQEGWMRQSYRRMSRNQSSCQKIKRLLSC